MTTLEDIVMDVIHAYMDIIKIQTASVSKMYVCAVMEILKRGTACPINGKKGCNNCNAGFISKTSMIKKNV